MRRSIERTALLLAVTCGLAGCASQRATAPDVAITDPDDPPSVPVARTTDGFAAGDSLGMQMEIERLRLAFEQREGLEMIELASEDVPID